MVDECARIIIEGVTEDNRPFRPSDWIERISGSLSTFGNDRRIRYSQFVQPLMIEGKRCLAVDRRLTDVNPAAFKFLMDFAKSNRLRMHDQAPPASEAHDDGLCPA
ncbi:MAG: DUF3579 domain-containing protein [Acidiferrobacteraceae bacterium]